MLRVLTYHRVAQPDEDPHLDPGLVSATPDVFETQMRYLADRYRVVSLQEVRASVNGGATLPDRAVLVTFDDAYVDFARNAWPVLQQLHLPATLFVPTAFPGHPERSFWWDRLHRAIENCGMEQLDCGTLGTFPLITPEERRATLSFLRAAVKRLPHGAAMRLVDSVCERCGTGDEWPPSVLDWEELRNLAGKGLSVVAHTRSHALLTRLPPEASRAELEGAREDLRRELGTTPIALAYPAGDHDAAVVDLARRTGYELAFTTLAGHNRVPLRDPLRIRRMNITPRATPLIFRARLRALGGALHQLRRRAKGWAPGRSVPSAGAGDGSSAPIGTRRADSNLPGAPIATGRDAPRVAYIMSRFPKLSETFVLYEMLAVERAGIRVEIFPLLRQRESVRHAEADAPARRAHFQPLFSASVLRENVKFLASRPALYLRTWAALLSASAGNGRFMLGALVFYPKAVWFAAEFQRLGIDHVHAHFATHPAMTALAVARLTGIPFSFTAHGSDLHVDRRMLGKKAEAAEFVVAVCDYNRRLIGQECGQAVLEKTRVIRCGIDPRGFAGEGCTPGIGSTDEGASDGLDRSVSFRAAKATRIVCVASLQEVKGHRFLIDACARCARRGLDFECLLIGGGPLQREIAGLIAGNGLSDRIRMLGPRPRAEVAHILAEADVAVLASAPTSDGRREGIPVALMEAMAAGLPVVATATGGIVELVLHGDTGLVVPPANPDALADALAALIEEPDRRAAMGARGRERVTRAFCLETGAERLAELFARSRERHSTRKGSGHSFPYGRGASATVSSPTGYR